MLLEYLGPETGRMLFDTFDSQRGDLEERRRLFKGMCRIMLSLAKIPQARIGSFCFHDDGTITLTNRSLCCSTVIIENDTGARSMQRDDTYTCTDAYVADMLALHDQRFLKQPNAVNDEEDCHFQMAIKILLRVYSRSFIQKRFRQWPFLLQLTDLHASNLLVDQDWNVTGLIDLEWICALPLEMYEVPYWLTGCAIDGLKGEGLVQFNQVRQEFLRIFEEEEQSNPAHAFSLTRIMEETWDSGGVWFWYCLSSVNAMYFLLEAYILPAWSLSAEAEKIISKFWSRDSEADVKAKLEDRKAYDEELRELFRHTQDA